MYINKFTYFSCKIQSRNQSKLGKSPKSGDISCCGLILLSAAANTFHSIQKLLKNFKKDEASHKRRFSILAYRTTIVPYFLYQSRQGTGECSYGKPIENVVNLL